MNVKRGATHRPELFQEYIPYDGAEGEGFRILSSAQIQEIYIFDDYGSWVDKELNYYDKNGDPCGYFDPEFNFYDMRGVRIPGGFRGGSKIERKIQEKLRFLENIGDRDNRKFVVEIQNLPASTTPSQIIAYVLERCNVTQDMIEECKKVQKDTSKGYVVVRGATIVQRLLNLEGRRFRVKDKDGKYITKEIQLFIRESKFNGGGGNNNPIGNQRQQQQHAAPVNQPTEWKISYDNLDPKKTDEEFIDWICLQAQCQKGNVEFSRTMKKTSGTMIPQDEDLMYRILKQNGRRFGDLVLQLKQVQ